MNAIGRNIMSAKTQNVDAVRATQDSAGGDTRYRYPPQTVCKLPRSGLDMAIGGK